MHQRVTIAKQSTAATRSLITEIASLRDDIHEMARAIAAIEFAVATLYSEMLRANRPTRMPHPLRYPQAPEAE